jgi:hypothetical protein
VTNHAGNAKPYDHTLLGLKPGDAAGGRVTKACRINAKEI